MRAGAPVVCAGFDVQKIVIASPNDCQPLDDQQVTDSDSDTRLALVTLASKLSIRSLAGYHGIMQLVRDIGVRIAGSNTQAVRAKGYDATDSSTTSIPLVNNGVE